MVVTNGFTSVDPRGNTSSRAWNHVEKATGVTKNYMLCRIKVDCALNTHRSPLPRLLTQVLVFVNDFLAWYNLQKCEDADSCDILS